MTQDDVTAESDGSREPPKEPLIQANKAGFPFRRLAYVLLLVLAIVFAALAVYCLRSVWRAGRERGNGGRMLLVALVGGFAAIAAAGAAAWAIILFQLATTAA